MAATIHPFPARMAPELALEALTAVAKGGVVVDPMMGSGTVVRQASDLGLSAIGFDVDPLAVLMSQVWTTPIDDAAIGRAWTIARTFSRTVKDDEVELPWIDGDQETGDFIKYWFGTKQQKALRRWAWGICSLQT